MKKNILIFSMLVLACIGQLFAQKNLTGRYYSEESCASGGDSYFFISQTEVIKSCAGCSSSPFANLGTYKVIGNEISMTFHTLYHGKGINQIFDGSNNEHFEKYTAVKAKSSQSEKIGIGLLFDAFDDTDCGENGTHDFKNVHQFLKTQFVGKYGFTSERLLSETELAKYSKAELKIMRNEVFARYGYIFKTVDMSKYFAAQPLYSGSLENVDAFLSEIETKNIALIKAAESK